MFYSLVKIFVLPALRIFCTKTTVTGKKSLLVTGPVLLVANHPNSFLDAIVLGAQFDRPVHFLARGDAFHKPWHNRLLRLLNMIPVYRLSEGKENLHLNEIAFQRSREVLNQGGIVLIFIEGICLNTHKLQPFKKGAARIAWENRLLPVFSVLPVGIAFDSFDRFGKEVTMHFGKPLLPQALLPFDDEARSYLHFNKILFDELAKSIDVAVPKPSLSAAEQVLFFFIAAAGWLIHAPFYYPVKYIVRAKTRGTVFYDSVLFGVLFLLYPFYLLLLCCVWIFSGGSLSSVVLLFLLSPLCALVAVRWHKSISVKAC